MSEEESEQSRRRRKAEFNIISGGERVSKGRQRRQHGDEDDS